jgi:hypothetical protein
MELFFFFLLLLFQMELNFIFTKKKRKEDSIAVAKISYRITCEKYESNTFSYALFTKKKTLAFSLIYVF